MIDFSEFFSSRCKYRVLRVLVKHHHPLSLRKIMYFSEESSFSVQRCLEQMVCEKWILKKKEKNRCYFTVNPHHPDYSSLKSLYDLESNLQLQQSDEEDLSVKIKEILSFSQEVSELTRGLRL